jgi:hypothetical protein
MYHIECTTEMSVILTHLFKLYIVNFYDARRPENNQDHSKLARVILFAENT